MTFELFFASDENFFIYGAAIQRRRGNLIVLINPSFSKRKCFLFTLVD